MDSFLDKELLPKVLMTSNQVRKALIRISHEIYEKHIQLSIRWIPSHLKPDLPSSDIPPGVSTFDIIANDLADKQAALAAHAVEVPLNVSTPVIYYAHLVKRIQKRHQYTSQVFFRHCGGRVRMSFNIRCAVVVID